MIIVSMKFINKLMIVPSLLFLFSCNRGNNFPTPLPDGSLCELSFNGEHVVALDMPKKVPMNQDVVINLKVDYLRDISTDWKNGIPSAVEIAYNNPATFLDKEIEEYILNPDNIEIAIDGKVYDDCFDLYYTNNDDCQLVILKDYVVNNINITCKAFKRNYLFLKGILMDGIVDYTHYANDSYTEDTEPYHIKFLNKYQNTFGTIPNLGETGFTILEDDDIDVVIESNQNKDDIKYLPDNVFVRMNARWISPIGNYTIDVVKDSNGNVIKYHFYIPHYFVNDHINIIERSN